MSVLLNSPDDYLWAILLGGVFVLVFTGRLVPKPQVDRLLAVKDQQIALLTEAHRDDKAAIAKLAESSRLGVAVVEAIGQGTP
ncbi:Uncharacterised protein [Mycobacteroides abscessus subsp. bolletii]|uniref:hypothetical protein n=1 Tax=Mycobacteroides abscessus TaxID=36809 RepID=UPI0009261AD0|nr:hypothetical protein [Mycobacteroides abscessus]SHX31101.1 Uncharacterised protein [Mycobacteroides abscessus subsp. bolletii]SKP57537.1 Uncharacterised protein [Mycobacteroides abscessus subsp. bolletii]SKP81467.1 Uncharacterised protein [Mycobacteroides abscessus subsp. bolletii]SKQ37243.1 Uncharacterised protein [Mycobacteroides abscessus subsp. bolletii]